MSLENGLGCQRYCRKIVTSGWGDVPRLAKMVFEKPVRPRNVARCFVISSCIVQTLLDKQSFLEETFCAEAI